MYIHGGDPVIDVTENGAEAVLATVDAALSPLQGEYAGGVRRISPEQVQARLRELGVEVAETRAEVFS